MSRRGLPALAVALALALMPGARAAATAGPVQPAAPNTLTAAERAAGWRLLFDGRTIAQWRGFKLSAAPANWAVEDAAITRIAEGPDLVSVEEFGSFDFRFDWMVAPGQNSGVMFRVTEAGEATYETGPEYQVLDNARHADGQSPLTSAASCYALYAPPRDYSHAAGSWNEGRIIVAGNRVEHWLNGQQAVGYEIGSAEWNAKVAASKFNEWKGFGQAARGHLALQQHDGRVQFRNLKIKTSQPRIP